LTVKKLLPTIPHRTTHSLWSVKKIMLPISDTIRHESFYYKQSGVSTIQKQLFLQNGLILGVTAIINRTVGMVFRIFLGNTIGSEGLGLYQLALSVYLVFLTVSASGISLCTTRMYADHAAAGQLGKAQRSVEKCMAFSFAFGLILCVILLITAEPIAVFLLREERTVPALFMLAPSLPFMAVSSAVRGYFLARRKTLPTSGEQLLEQFLEIAVFAAVFALHQPADLAEACCMAVTGTTAAEMISFVYALLCYLHDKKKLCVTGERVSGLFRSALPIFLPVSANACLRSGLSAAENALIPMGLQRFGLSSSAALAQYGIISGMTLTVLVFPSVVILPFASLLIPEIAEARISLRTNSIRHISEKMIRLTLQYALPVMVIFLFYGIPLCRLLFGNDDAGKYLTMLAPVIPFMYLDSVVDAILKGLDRQTDYFIFNTIDSVIRVLLTVLLLPFFGIAGVIAVIVISELLNTLLSLGRLMHITELRLPLFKSVVLPVFAAVLPCLLLQPFCHIGSESFNLIFRLVLSCTGCFLLLWSHKKICRTE